MKASNYDDYSREDLIRLINERDRKPKFGLLWERDEIDHDRSVNSDFVALDLDPELSCGEDPHKNLIVEGDNFDALRYLRMTHSGLVKCIYPDFDTSEAYFRATSSNGKASRVLNRQNPRYTDC